MRIIGISFDTPEDNAAWAAKKLFRFELWSDEDRSLALHYGAAKSVEQRTASRETRLLDAEGNYLLGYDVGLGIGTHPFQVLEDCQKIWGEVAPSTGE